MPPGLLKDTSPPNCSHAHPPSPQLPAASASRRQTLTSLPTELHLEILSHLPLPAPQHLQRTSRHFSTLVPPPTLATLIAEEPLPWARERQYLACSACVRYHRRSAFADDMTVRDHAPGGPRAAQRVCIPCGVRGGRYTPGTDVCVGGRTHVVCLQCRRYRTDVGPKGSRSCRECWAREEKVQVGKMQSLWIRRGSEWYPSDVEVGFGFEEDAAWNLRDEYE